MPSSDSHFIPILDELHDQDASPGEPPTPIRSGPDPLRRKRGGRRPGAGAPRGNLNGLKTGRHSKLYKQLARALLETPEAHQLLLRIAKRQRKVRKEKEFGASQLTAEILRRVGEIVLDPESNQSESNLAFLNVLRTAEACPEPVEGPVYAENSKSNQKQTPTFPIQSKSCPAPSKGERDAS